MTSDIVEEEREREKRYAKIDGNAKFVGGKVIKLKDLTMNRVFGGARIADDDGRLHEDEAVRPRRHGPGEHDHVRDWVSTQQTIHLGKASNQIGRDSASPKKWHLARVWLKHQFRFHPLLQDFYVQEDQALIARQRAKGGGIGLPGVVAFMHGGQKQIDTLPSGAADALHRFAVLAKIAETAGMRVKRKHVLKPHCPKCGHEKTGPKCRVCARDKASWQTMIAVHYMLDRVIPTEGVRLPAMPGRKAGRPPAPKPHEIYNADLKRFAESYADIALKLFQKKCPGVAIETNISLDELAIAADAGDVSATARVAHIVSTEIVALINSNGG